MLSLLRIRQLAIVDEIELELGPGLNIVTGETGAGKSLLVDALTLVLGGRADPSSVREGADAAEVEALFDLGDRPDLRERLGDLVGSDAELVVRRVVRRAGRSRAYVNGRLVTIAELAAATDPLVDLCSQHEHHALGDAATHLDLLDAYAALQASRASMAAAWEAWHAAARELRSARALLEARAEREAVVQVQLEEIAAVDPVPGEDATLESERSRLAHAERLRMTASSLEDGLWVGEGAAAGVVARGATELEAAASLDGDLRPLAAELHQVRSALEAIGRELGAYARSISSDPTRLQQVEERLAALRRLTRRHGGTLDSLIAARARLQAEHDQLGDLDQELDLLERAHASSSRAAVEAARTLSTARQGAARGLGAAVTSELHDLGMGRAVIHVDVARLPGRGDGLEVDGAHVSVRGMDRAELQIAPNAGEPPQPLRKIASGGELSRALLAVKRVLSALQPSGLQVFDEVDTGVGGGIAESIGRKLDEVAASHQVLCITHLAQVAAYADQHLHVDKVDAGGRTATRVRTLDRATRVEEIARMMGGLTITDETRAAARALLDQADAARSPREAVTPVPSPP